MLRLLLVLKTVRAGSESQWHGVEEGSGKVAVFGRVERPAPLKLLDHEFETCS